VYSCNFILLFESSPYEGLLATNKQKNYVNSRNCLSNTYKVMVLIMQDLSYAAPGALSMFMCVL
jgi:hypothetical protein